MAKTFISEQYLLDIANAIRIKTGEVSKYYPAEMANAIMRIGSTDGVNFLIGLSLSDGWKFNLVSRVSDTSYSSTAEAQENYDDSEWRNVSVPHDWSIELDFDPNAIHGYDGHLVYSEGFLAGGDAWYRRKIPNMSYARGKRFYLYFDGVYMESDVYINGVLKKENRNWYNPFWIDITDSIDVNSDNIIAVFVRNQQPSTHWYSGSGIYRNVYLFVCEPAEVTLKNIIVRTPGLETEVGGDVTTEVVVDTFSTVSKTVPVKVEVIKDETAVATVATEMPVTVGDNQFQIDVVVNDPDLWDVYEGNLYTVKLTLTEGDKKVYHSVNYGYRYFNFDATTGFWMNGKNIKLKGVSIHDTYGCLGSKANKSAIEREIDALIEMGCNAVRTAHNAFSSEFMTVCAEKGVLVYEEFFDCWNKYKIPNDFARYFDDNYQEVIADTIRRDVNNPAIILWGAGNEIISQKGDGDYYSSEQATAILQNIINVIHRYDISRPIAMSDDTPTWNASLACMALLDVIGVNYGDANEYTGVISTYPNKPIFGSETTAAYMIRGDYSDPLSSNYDEKHATWAPYTISEALHLHMDNQKYAGMFPWCGIDYIGEGAPYRAWPQRSCADGALDTALFKKDAFYLYQSVWSNKPMIHIVPMHWDWTDGENVKVWLYSNCASVELWLNGVNLGSATKGEKYQFAYSVPFTRGTLVANGYDSNNRLVAQDVLYTSRRQSTKLILSADKTKVNINSDDLVFVTCVISDKNDVVLPLANNTITFDVIGGEVVGTDSGWVKDVENMTGKSKKASFGKILCVVKHNGKSGDLIITASSDYLSPASIVIEKGEVSEKSVKPVQEYVDASDPPIKNYSDDPIYQIRSRLYINDGANITISQNGTQLNIRG